MANMTIAPQGYGDSQMICTKGYGKETSVGFDNDGPVRGKRLPMEKSEEFKIYSPIELEKESDKKVYSSVEKSVEGEKPVKATVSKEIYDSRGIFADVDHKKLIKMLEAM